MTQSLSSKTIPFTAPTPEGLQKYVTRVAPSNTGAFSCALLKVAIHNALLARASGGKCYLRIDSTDLARSKQEYTDDILRKMEYFGLEFDGVEYQHKRYDIYRHYVEKLRKMGCIKEEDGCIRFVPQFYPEYWEDCIAGRIYITDEDKKTMMGSDGKGCVIWKSDGSPVFHFCGVADDCHMGTTMVCRGVDHMSNTSTRHVTMFAHMLEKDQKMPEFMHTSLIFVNKKKMSKRDGLSNIQHHIDRGICKEALLNYCLRLGWSPTDPNFDRHTPLISMDLAKKIFLSGGRLKSSNIAFDVTKLDWYNKQWSKHLTGQELTKLQSV